MNQKVSDIRSAAVRFTAVLYSTPGFLGPDLHKADLAMRVANQLRTLVGRPVTYTSAAELIERLTLGSSRQQMTGRCKASCAAKVEQEIIRELDPEHQVKRKVVAAMLGPELIREVAENGKDTSHIILIELKTSLPTRMELYRRHPDYSRMDNYDLERMFQTQRAHQRDAAAKYHYDRPHGPRPHPTVVLEVTSNDTRDSVSRRIAEVVTQHLPTKNMKSIAA